MTIDHRPIRRLMDLPLPTRMMTEEEAEAELATRLEASAEMLKILRDAKARTSGRTYDRATQQEWDAIRDQAIDRIHEMCLDAIDRINAVAPFMPD